MKVNVFVYPIAVLVIFLGVIQLSRLTPYWNTNTRNVATASFGTGQSSSPSGEISGALVDTADIRGSWALGDVAKTFQVPATEIREKYGIPASVPESTLIKDLSQYNPDFETSVLREWLKERSPVAKK